MSKQNNIVFNNLLGNCYQDQINDISNTVIKHNTLININKNEIIDVNKRMITNDNNIVEIINTQTRIANDNLDFNNFNVYNVQLTGNFSKPPAPTINSVTLTTDGIVVDFNHVYVSPSVRYYVVSSGQNGVAITVNAKILSKVVLPVITGQTTAEISVQAVNEYGYSSKTVFPSKLTNLSSVTVNPNIKTVQILEFSDFHGAIETSTANIGAAILKTAFDRDRSIVPCTYVVSVGDNFGASPPISSQFEEIPTIECLNLMNIDVSCLGNHEHDRVLSHFTKMLGLSEFKWLASNYSTLTPLVSGSKNVSSYIISEKNGIKVGFIGFQQPSTASTVAVGNLDYLDISNNKKTLEIYSDIYCINNSIEQAKKSGADIIVALLHCGWSTNEKAKAYGDLCEYARLIEGADIVYGAHSHQNYRSIYKSDTFPYYRLVGQTPNSGTQYNRSLITYDTNKKQILGMNIDTVSFADVSSLTPDPTITTLVQKYKNLLIPKFDVLLNKVDLQFPGGGDIPFRPDRRQESYMGHFITNLIRNKAKTNFAIVNGGGIRDTLPALTYVTGNKTYLRPDSSKGQDQVGPFDVLLGDIVTVFPFGNSVSIVTVTGKTIWDAIKWGVTGYPGNGRFPQVSGLRFTFNTRLKFIVSITTDDFIPIPNDDSKTYTLALPDFMVYGGDGYTMFNPSKATFPGYLIVDVLKEKLELDRSLNKITNRPILDGRITLENK